MVRQAVQISHQAFGQMLRLPNAVIHRMKTGFLIGYALNVGGHLNSHISLTAQSPGQLPMGKSNIRNDRCDFSCMVSSPPLILTALTYALSRRYEPW
jgi:hypothetical protein